MLRSFPDDPGMSRSPCKPLCALNVRPLGGPALTVFGPEADSTGPRRDTSSQMYLGRVRIDPFARDMQRTIAVVSLIASGLAVTTGLAQEQPPAWAYPEYKGEVKPPADDGSIRRVPDSAAGYTLSQVRDRFLAPDWHPADHPPMPDVVSKGRKPDVFGCSFCHRADGPGGPENANLWAGHTLTSCSKWLT